MVSEKMKNNIQKWSCFHQNGQKWLFLKVFFGFCGQPYIIKSFLTFFLKKKKITFKNYHVLTKTAKNSYFWRYFWILWATILYKRLFDIFSIFHPKGRPLWFRTSQKLTTPLKMAESWKNKYFCEQNYQWIKNSDGTACLKGSI